MTKHYHRLLADEILKRRNELFPNGHPCGWERTLKVNQSLEVKSQCALTENLSPCVYTGLQRKQIDYELCPVYQAKLKQWQEDLKLKGGLNDR